MGQPAPVQRPPVAWIELEGLIKTFDGLLKVTLLSMDHTALAEDVADLLIERSALAGGVQNRIIEQQHRGLIQIGLRFFRVAQRGVGLAAIFVQ